MTGIQRNFLYITCLKYTLKTSKHDFQDTFFLLREKCKDKTMWSSSTCSIVGWKCTHGLELGLELFSCSRTPSWVKRKQWFFLSHDGQTWNAFCSHHLLFKRTCNITLVSFLCYIPIISTAAYSCLFHLDNLSDENNLSNLIFNCIFRILW